MSDLNSETAARRPKVNSASQRELDKVEEQLEKFNDEIKNTTLDQLNFSSKAENEGPKISQKEIANSKDVYLKPVRSMYPVNKNNGKSPEFNERFREEYNFAKEYVHFIFENKECIGETTTIWTLPFPGLPAEEWRVPCNKPVWGPRYLAEQIKRCFYHRLKMEESTTTSSDGMGKYYGAMTYDTTIQRLDAHPVSSRRSVFMGKSDFK